MLLLLLESLSGVEQPRVLIGSPKLFRVSGKDQVTLTLSLSVGSKGINCNETLSIYR